MTFVPLAAAFNLRDLGGPAADGGTVRRGLLFRSDTLHRLEADDLQVLRDLGLRTVIDLRAADELARHGRVGLADDEVAFHHLPVFDDTQTIPLGAGSEDPVADLVALYVHMLETGGPALRRAVEVLAEPGALPGVFHCMAGKDRTGILAALILSVLGVDDDDVAADYARTMEARPRFEAWLATAAPDALPRLTATPAWVREAPSEVAHRLLAHVRERHGSARGLLRDLGVAEDTLDRLADTLLEVPGSAA